MKREALEMVETRNEFYRDNYQRVMIALVFALMLNLVLLTILVYLVANPPKPVYFATTADGVIQKLIPLDQPNMTKYALLQWANEAAIAAYTYDFVSYRKQLTAASNYFTDDGWRDFMKALEASNNLKAVINKKLNVTAVATGAPIIQTQGVENGVYTWRVQMPLLITYENANQLSQQNVTVILLIERVSTLTYARGVGIAQFVVKENGAINF